MLYGINNWYISPKKSAFVKEKINVLYSATSQRKWACRLIRSEFETHKLCIRCAVYIVNLLAMWNRYFVKLGIASEPHNQFTIIHIKT